MTKIGWNLIKYIIAASALILTTCKDDKDRLSVLPVELVFNADDNSVKTVTVDTNAKSWNAAETDSWITVTLGEDKFTVAVDPWLDTNYGREGAIVVRAGSAKEITIIVKQNVSAQHTLSLSHESIIFGEDDIETKGVVITTNFSGSWNHSSPPDWLILEKKGNTLEITPNSVHTAEQPRTATITITAGNASEKTVLVTQNKSMMSFRNTDCIYYGDYYESGTANFEMYLFNLTQTNEIIDLLHIEGFSALPVGSPFKLELGTYELAETMAAKTFFDGIIYEGNPYGAFYFDTNAQRLVLVKGGTFDVALNGNIYTITTDFIGVLYGTNEEVELRCKYTGTISFFDESGEPLGGIERGTYVATGEPSWFGDGPTTWEGNIVPNTVEQNFEIEGFDEIDWLIYYLKYVDDEVLLDDETRTNVIYPQNPEISAYMRIFCDLEPENEEGYLIYWEQGLEWLFEYDETENALIFDWYLEDEEDPTITFPILIGLAACDESGDILGLSSDLYANLRLELTPASTTMQKFGGMSPKKNRFSTSSGSKTTTSSPSAINKITLDKSNIKTIPKNQLKRFELKSIKNEK